MNKKMIFGLLCFAVAIIGIMAPANAVVDSISSENKVFSIDSKEKTAKIRLTWDTNGGAIGGKKILHTTINKGSKIAKLPATPKRTGHTFEAWYAKKTAGKKVTVNTKPTKNDTYIARWLKIYTLTFDPNGGTVKPTSKKVTHKKALGTLAKPTRSDYTFNGWFSRENGGTKVSSSTKMPAKNMVVYAQWKMSDAAIKKKLVGNWYQNYNNYTLIFKGDNTYYAVSGDSRTEEKGSYSIKSSKIIITNKQTRYWGDTNYNYDWSPWTKSPGWSEVINIYKKNGKDYFEISGFPEGNLGYSKTNGSSKTDYNKKLVGTWYQEETNYTVTIKNDGSYFLTGGKSSDHFKYEARGFYSLSGFHGNLLALTERWHRDYEPINGWDPWSKYWRVGEVLTLDNLFTSKNGKDYFITNEFRISADVYYKIA